QGPNHAVHAGRCVGHEGNVVRVRADEARDFGADAIEETLEIANEELNELLLHAAPELALGLEHRTRARAKRTVIQVRDSRVDYPKRVESLGVRHRTSMHCSRDSRIVLGSR